MFISVQQITTKRKEKYLDDHIMSETYFHIESLSPLYEDVQSAGIFSDSKYFVDALPKYSASTILENYSSQKKEDAFSLLGFIQAHFILPESHQETYSSADKSIDQHLNELWDVLQRKPDTRAGTLIPLPYPYIVPGGRFREIYYWDSYFTMLGLQVSGRMDLIENMIKNFAYLIDTIGHIPNGNRTYYISRSQPPFFALMVSLLASIKGEQVYLEYFSALEKEYAFWMKGSEQVSENNPSTYRVVRMPNGSLLNRYWDDNPSPRPEAYIEDIHIAAQSQHDPLIVYRHIRAAAESGWDFSSRWFEIPDQMHTIQTTDIIPVDLNCLLLHLESVLQIGFQLRGEHSAAQRLSKAMNQRIDSIQQYCWNAKDEFYFDYHYIQQKNTQRITLAACFPLFISIANEQQAIAVANKIKSHLLGDGGVQTTYVETGQQWDAPNGWAPLQWVTYKGLVNYQQDMLAEEIRQRWLKLNEKTYHETGKMMEKYNVANMHLKAGGGEYPNQDGFGWTNGVYLALKKQ